MGGGILDRLSRNSYFIDKLLETKVPFVDCQSPHDSPFITRIRAASAQEELEKISQRTKAALASYKERGGLLGGSRPECRNLTQEARELGAQRASVANKENADAAYVDLLPQMKAWRKQGLTLADIAAKLNDEGHTTRRGKAWNHVQVNRVLSR
jgi:DNA invertase Pin-like site-specific DNA recombinase